MRFHLAKGKYEEMVRRANAIERLQTNIRAFILLKDWEWMKIIFKIKPLISQAENEKEMLELEKNYNDVKDQLEKERKRRTELEGLKKVMEEERDELEAVMGKQMSAIEDIEGRCDELITIKIDLDTKMEELQEKLDDEEELNSDLIKHRKKLEVESEKLKNEIQEHSCTDTSTTPNI